MIKRAALASLLLLAAALSAPADELLPPRRIPPGTESVTQDDGTPAALRWMIRPLRRGMFIRLPVMDTDPNRGITVGVMPIVVLQAKDQDRIEQIHAPSVTYNKNFGVIPTYRYYYYPQPDASLVARASISKYEGEGMAQYEDAGFLGTDKDVLLRGQFNIDAGRRYYGDGPDTQKTAEGNYKENYWQYQWGVGTPLREGSSWRARVSQRYQAERVLDGPLSNLPRFRDIYPAEFSDRAQQTDETRLSLLYDTRDHAVTTTRGTYLETYAEAAVRGFLSQYDYKRYGFDARWFKPQGEGDARVFAIQTTYEQILGATPPFWILPSLGGKYSLRAYGDGRYVDRGAATLNAEERFKVFEAKTAGVTTEFQLAPFAGVGTVFDSPGTMAGRYLRPVVGAAIRAVARPQVVGSVDFGVGREGLSVFMDINYSF